MKNEKTIPILPQQKRFVTYEMREESKGCQNVGIVLKLEGNTDIKRFDEILEKLVRINDAFFVRMVSNPDGTISQEFCDDYKFHWVRHDMTAFSESEREQKAFSDAEQEVCQKTDIFHEPLFAFHLYEISEHCVLLLIKANHTIVDGSSFSAIYAQLADFWNQKIPPAVCTWKEFVAWETELIASEKGKQSLEYWKSNNVSEISVSVPKLSGISAEEKSIPLEMLKKTSRLYKTSIFNVMLYLYTVSLAELFEQETFSVNCTMTNRFEESMRYMVGLTTHSFPYVLKDISKSLPSELIAETKKQMCESFSNFYTGEYTTLSPFTLSYFSETVKLPEWNGLTVTQHPCNGSQNYRDMTYTLFCKEKKDVLELEINTDRTVFTQDFDNVLFAKIKNKLCQISGKER